MSGPGNADGDGDVDSPPRTATVRTRHDDPALVRDALAPDNTDSMEARVDGDAVVCAIERGTTGGLQSTVDDYLVNLGVADRLVDRGRNHRRAVADDRDRTDRDRNERTRTGQDRRTNETNGHTTDADTTDADTTDADTTPQT